MKLEISPSWLELFQMFSSILCYTVFTVVLFVPTININSRFTLKARASFPLLFCVMMQASRTTIDDDASQDAGRDGRTCPRDQILTRERGQGNIHFPYSADHERDWQSYPVDPYSAIYVTTIHIL